MSSRSTARKVRPSPKAARHKPARKSAPKKGKKLAKVTRFPSHKVARKPLPSKKHSAAKKQGHSRPPAEPQHVPRNLPPLTAPKQVQQPKQSLARSFYWSELRVGDDLPPLTQPAIDRVQIVRYSASAGDFNRLHLDEPYA